MCGAPYGNLTRISARGAASKTARRREQTALSHAQARRRRRALCCEDDLVHPPCVAPPRAARDYTTIRPNIREFPIPDAATKKLCCLILQGPKSPCGGARVWTQSEVEGSSLPAM